MKLPAFILTFQEHVVEAVPLLKQERDDLCTCIYACMFLWLHNFSFFFFWRYSSLRFGAGYNMGKRAAL